MKKIIISWVPQIPKCTFRIFRSLDKGRISWYNILGDNKGRISHIKRLDTIPEGSILLTIFKIAMKRENSESIITVKRTEWMKFVDYDRVQDSQRNKSSE